MDHTPLYIVVSEDSLSDDIEVVRRQYSTLVEKVKPDVITLLRPDSSEVVPVVFQKVFPNIDFTAKLVDSVREPKTPAEDSNAEDRAVGEVQSLLHQTSIGMLRNVHIHVGASAAWLAYKLLTVGRICDASIWTGGGGSPLLKIDESLDIEPDEALFGLYSQRRSNNSEIDARTLQSTINAKTKGVENTFRKSVDKGWVTTGTTQKGMTSYSLTEEGLAPAVLSAPLLPDVPNARKGAILLIRAVTSEEKFKQDLQEHRANLNHEHIVIIPWRYGNEIGTEPSRHDYWSVAEEFGATTEEVLEHSEPDVRDVLVSNLETEDAICFSGRLLDRIHRIRDTRDSTGAQIGIEWEIPFADLAPRAVLPMITRYSELSGMKMRFLHRRQKGGTGTHGRIVKGGQYDAVFSINEALDHEALELLKGVIAKSKPGNYVKCLVTIYRHDSKSPIPCIDVSKDNPRIPELNHELFNPGSTFRLDYDELGGNAVKQLMSRFGKNISRGEMKRFCEVLQATTPRPVILTPLGCLAAELALQRYSVL